MKTVVFLNRKFSKNLSFKRATIFILNYGLRYSGKLGIADHRNKTNKNNKENVKSPMNGAKLLETSLKLD